MSAKLWRLEKIKSLKIHGLGKNELEMLWRLTIRLLFAYGKGIFQEFGENRANRRRKGE
jgi:hypothetical protein